MNSIKNGFCYSFGKFLFKFLIGVILFLIASVLLKDFDFKYLLCDDVFAISPNNWYDAKLDLTPTYIRDGQNHTTYDNGYSLVLPNYENIPSILFGSGTASSSSPLRLNLQVPYMQSDYAYEIDLYSCGTTLPTYAMPYSLDYLSQSINNNRIFSGSSQYENLSGVPGDGQVTTSFSTCRVNTFYLYGQSGVWLSFPIINSYDSFYFLGYKFYNLGISKDSILSGISGSQSSVLSAIQSMQSQLHQDANDIYQNVNDNATIINSNINSRYDSLHQDANDIYNNVNRQSANIQSNQNANNQQLISNNNSNNQALINNNNSNFNTLNSNITDDNIDNSQTSNIFDNQIFEEETDVLDLVTLPINFLQSLNSSQCIPLSFQMPIVHTQVVLPCMSTIYVTYFNDILTIYRLITTGLIVYYCILSIIKTIQKLLDPTVATVEVYDL